MIANRVALLLGLFVIPLIALRLGNRFRDQSVGRRRGFWGAVVGHMAGMTITVGAALYPPVLWEEGLLLREFLVHWSMLLGSALGALVARLHSLVTDQG